jgi:predicted phage-related endonuclease
VSLLTQDEKREAGRERWLAARRRVVTSTDSPILYGQGYLGSSVAKLWGQKTGRLPEDEETYLMRRGKLSEPIMLQLYEHETGRKVIRAAGDTLNVSEKYPWLGCSLDAVDSDGVYLELKRTTHKFRTAEEIPLRWVIQTQHQMVVMDVPMVRLVMDQPFEMVVIEVPRNEAFIERLLVDTKEFYESLSDDHPPAPKYGVENEGLSLLYRDLYEPGSTAELDGLEFEPVLEELSDVKRKQKELEERRSLAEAKLKHALGEAEVGLFPDRPEWKVTWKKTAKGYRALRITGMEVPE